MGGDLEGQVREILAKVDGLRDIVVRDRALPGCTVCIYALVLDGDGNPKIIILVDLRKPLVLDHLRAMLAEVVA